LVLPNPDARSSLETVYRGDSKEGNQGGLLNGKLRDDYEPE